MLEIVIERWTGLDGRTEFRWSLWQDGRRLLMGGPHEDARRSEEEARLACRERLACEPDRVTRL